MCVCVCVKSSKNQAAYCAAVAKYQQKQTLKHTLTLSPPPNPAATGSNLCEYSIFNLITVNWILNSRVRGTVCVCEWKESLLTRALSLSHPSMAAKKRCSKLKSQFASRGKKSTKVKFNRKKNNTASLQSQRNIKQIPLKKWRTVEWKKCAGKPVKIITR